MNNKWTAVDGLAQELATAFGEPPTIALVLGSGLGTVAAQLSSINTLSSHQFSLWPRSTTPGHAGKVHMALAFGVRTLIVEGRVHGYEGYGPDEVVLPIRAMVRWGAKHIILTNAAGGISDSAMPGRLMLIEDHLNLTGRNPLVGPGGSGPGVRFPDLTQLYDPTLRNLALTGAEQLGIPIFSGVYAGVLGPTYETRAEVRMLRQLGADAVGMSTVAEAIAAFHMGAKVLGISTITNRAAGLPGAILDHDHVQQIGASAAVHLAQMLSSVIPAMGAAL